MKQKEKFIIFGYHMEMLNALSSCLKRLKADFIRIDGTTRNDLRSTYIDRFQKQSSCQVAVLSLKGNYIICATYVILMYNTFRKNSNK